MGKPARGGKSGLYGNTVPDNVRRGRPQGKCHRKQTADTPRGLPVRVKGCGKSAPRARRRAWRGKPHREQDRIGKAGGFGPRMGFRIAFRVGRARRPATDVPDEWPSIARKGGDRTRLIGRLTLFIINGRPPLKLRMHDALLTQAFPKLTHASPNCRQIELYKNINRTHCDI